MLVVTSTLPIVTVYYPERERYFGTLRLCVRSTGDSGALVAAIRKVVHSLDPTTHMESDLRPGGAWLMRGIGADSRHFTVRGEYRAIERPRLLEFTWLPDWQEDAPLTLVRFDLEEKDGFTTVRLTHSGHTTERSRESHQGWPHILARLQAYVSLQELSRQDEAAIDAIYLTISFLGAEHQSIAGLRRGGNFFVAR